MATKARRVCGRSALPATRAWLHAETRSRAAAGHRCSCHVLLIGSVTGEALRAVLAAPSTQAAAILEDPSMTDQLRHTTIAVRTDPLEAPTPQPLTPWPEVLACRHHLAAPRRRELLGWVAAAVVLGGGRAASPAASATRLRVGVASCADQRQPQPIWDAVLTEQPDFFVFAGDNVYASEQPFEVELVASFRSRRSFSHWPRCMATASCESGAVRKMVGYRGRVWGRNTRDRRVFWPIRS